MDKKWKYGILIFLFALMLCSAMVTNAYLPWKTFKSIAKNCTQPTTAVIAEDGAQSEDGVYYYGPQVEFVEYATGHRVRVDIVNTVNINKTWKKGEYVAVYYNPKDASEVILRDDNTARNNFRSAAVIGGLLSAIGLAVFIVTLVQTYRVPKPKAERFKKNAAGQSFKEWQKQQLAEENYDRDEAEDSENDESSEEEHNA